MVKLLFSLMLVFTLLMPTKSLSNVDEVKNFDMQRYLYEYPKIFNQYPQDVIKLADKLEKNKKELYLNYRDRADLLETVHIIWAATYGDKIFTARHVASVIAVESKFDQYAHNKKDGGKGLTQTMHKYWKDQLPWYINPYDKKQSVCAGVSVLRIIKAGKACSTWETVRFYNGKAPASIIYKNRVHSVYKRLA